MAVKVIAKTGPLQEDLRRWLKGTGAKAALEGVRSVAAEVVRETTEGIAKGLDGTPKRLDTGEYLGGWIAGAREAKVPAPRNLKPRQRDSKGRFTLGGPTGKGFGRVQKAPVIQITIGNEVEHAGLVEYGTSRMAPGNHLARAIAVVSPQAGQMIREEIAAAWTLKG